MQVAFTSGKLQVNHELVTHGKRMQLVTCQRQNNKFMEKTKALKNRKLFGIAAILFLCVGIVHVGYKALQFADTPEWGAPWYFALFSPGIIYLFPLIVSFAAYRFFSKAADKGEDNL